MAMKLNFKSSRGVPWRCSGRYRNLMLACMAGMLFTFIAWRPSSRARPEPKKEKSETGYHQQSHTEREIYLMELKNRHNRRQDASIAAFQSDRQQFIGQSCKPRRPLDSLTRFERKLLFDQILVNDRYHFLYCFTPKVACSNWKKVLMAMDGKALRPENITKVDHARDVKHLHEYSAKEIDHRLKTYYKFMFVREPMARLASAFLNKFREIPSYMKKYGVPIIKLYRPHAPKNPKGDDVTWNEFVQYLLATPFHRYNQHWMPYKMLCQPCTVGYDFIGAYENLESEANYVIRQVKAGDHVAFPPRQRYYKPLKPEQLENMLSDTVPGNLQKLINLYKEDYDLFGYKPPLPHDNEQAKTEADVKP